MAKMEGVELMLHLILVFLSVLSYKAPAIGFLRLEDEAWVAWIFVCLSQPQGSKKFQQGRRKSFAQDAKNFDQLLFVM